MVLILDSGGVSALAERSRRAAALHQAIRDENLWPPIVPSAVLIECLRGDPRKDAAANRLLKTCDIRTDLDLRLARRAARLRTEANQGSAIDALVVASAEPGGSVLTSDRADLNALAAVAHDVYIDVV